jgi:hypothetical protein
MHEDMEAKSWKESWKERQEKADTIREKVVTEWGDWHPRKIELVEMVADLDRDEAEYVEKLIRNKDKLKQYFQDQYSVGRGDFI